MTRSIARVSVVALLATAALALTACSAIDPPGTDPSGVWGDSAPGAAQPYLELSGDGRVTGSDGCNRLLGDWKGDGRTVTFNRLASTRMACEDVDTWLSGAASGRVKDSTLIIYDTDGSRIGELKRSSDVPSATTQATSSAPVAGDANPALAGAWGVSEQGKPHLTFTDAGTVSGSDGCNLIAGSWKLADGVVTFGQLVSTLMACDQVDTWLGGASTATVSGATMTVYDNTDAKIGTLERAS
ncbi:META domain-containing protein [Glaciibacter flavus]|nr:META domain-containing protein [Glaciibacter flavus]